MRVPARFWAYDKILARELSKDVIVPPCACTLKRTRKASMRPSAKPFSSATHGSVKPSPACEQWFGLVRLASCFFVAFVLSLFFLPGEAQAHGLHGSFGVTAPVVATDSATTIEVLGDSEASESKCVACCASSTCAAISIPETFDLFVASRPTGGFQAASAVGVRQMAQHGLRRPPRQNC